MKRLEPVWLALVLLGALNWALVALFDFNVVEEILGTGTAADVVYVIVGFAALACTWATAPTRAARSAHAPRPGPGVHTRPTRLAPGSTLPACPPGGSRCVTAGRCCWRSSV